MDIEQILTRIEEKVDSLLDHHKEAAAMDSSLSHDPFAPDQPVSRVAAVQEQSAQELAPPNLSVGEGPGTINPEVFPTAPDAIVPSGESQSFASGDSSLKLSDGSSVGADHDTAAESTQEAAQAPAPSSLLSEPAPAASAPQTSPEPAPSAPGDQPVVAPVPDVDNDPQEPNPAQPAPTEQPVSPGEQSAAQGQA